MAEFMAGHVGETFAGTVSGVTRFGLFVLLPGGVEGLLGVEALPGRGYRYDETRLTLTEEGGGTAYTFGMPLEVVCAAADPATGQIDFVLPGGQLAPRPTRSGGAPGGDAPAPGERQAGHACAQGAEREEKTMTKRMLLAVLLLIVFALPAGCQKQGENRLSPPPPRPPFCPPPRQSRPPPPPPIGWGRPWRG